MVRLTGGFLVRDGVEYEGHFRTPIPFERKSTLHSGIEATNPTDEILDDFNGILTLVSPAEVEVTSTESWDEWAIATEVDEIFADENAIGLRVVSQVSHVNLAALVTMFGVCLEPSVGRLVVMIDVVTEASFEGCPLIRALIQKTGIFPVFVERHGLRYPHSVDKVSPSSLGFRPTTGYPITYGSSIPYSWLARGKRAIAEKGIRGKAVIMSDCV